GTDGGLYRSGNAGKSFSVSFTGGYWSAIAPAPSDPNIVYAAEQSSYTSTDPVIWKSLNKGLNWVPVATLPPGSRVIKLEVQPNNPSHLLALSGYEMLAASRAPRRDLYVSNVDATRLTHLHCDHQHRGMTG